MMTKARIAVIGAGLMGHGIAHVFAVAGHDVTITDAVAASLDSAKARIAASLQDLGDDPRAVERVTPQPDLAAAVRDADYVVEAVSENLPLKQKLFAEIEQHVRPDTILASNTSVIPITDIMGGLTRRERALGTHWWNPPTLVPLVEVIGTQWTSPQAIDFTMKLHADAGKKPAHVKKDVPGFIGNRLQHALWREAVSLVERGICDAETVDTVIKAAFGRRLGGARSVGERRSGRHRSHAGDPPDRAARHRASARSVALSRKAGRRRQARLQIGRGVPHLDARAAGGAAGEGRAASQEGARGRSCEMPQRLHRSHDERRIVLSRSEGRACPGHPRL